MHSRKTSCKQGWLVGLGY